jgi:hypothetical protein
VVPFAVTVADPEPRLDRRVRHVLVRFDDRMLPCVDLALSGRPKLAGFAQRG